MDHGKSTLVSALTGVDPDRLAQEKARGLTIELGFASTRLPSGREISFVDVPGHVNFIENMLAGVGMIRECLFIVAATEGWKPQSEEHLRILQLFDFSRGVIAVTKTDLVDEDIRELARSEITEAVRGTFLEGALMVDTDAPKGVGLVDLRMALDDVAQTEELDPLRNRPRLWIDRSFSIRGSGSVVTGTLTGGSLAVQDTLEILPMAHRRGGVRVRIRSMQTHNHPVDRATPGNRVAANITGVEHEVIRRGQALLREEQWRPSKTVDASLSVLPSLDHEVSRRGAYRAYVGSAHQSVKLRVLGEAAILPGESGLVRLHFPLPLPLVRGDRFVLRESGRSETVGGGEVLDVVPVLPASKARPDRSLDRTVAERGWILVEDLEAMAGERVPPNVGARWIVHPPLLADEKVGLRDLILGAGPLGLELRALDAHQRTLLADMDEFSISGTRVRTSQAAASDPLAAHPYLTLLNSEPFRPPSPKDAGVGRDELEELVRRELIVKWEDVYFSNDALAQAAEVVARLLEEHPDGVTAAQVKERLGTSRRFALPLLGLLDAGGVTRRRGDLRIGGPRLPTSMPRAK